MEKKFKNDPMKCLACSIMVMHSLEQHNDYLAIWCDKHMSWCGDHSHKSIKEQLDNQRRHRDFQRGLEHKRRMRAARMANEDVLETSIK